MRHTEFWARMDAALGAGYAPVWASSQVLSGLNGRTVQEALAAGEQPKQVWRVVAASLELPDSLR